MSRGISTVTDLWREWTVGLGGGPSIQMLEETRGSSWCEGNERRFYNRRKIIINKIRQRAASMPGGETVENLHAAQEWLEGLRVRGGKSLDWMSKNIEMCN